MKVQALAGTALQRLRALAASVSITVEMRLPDADGGARPVTLFRGPLVK